MSDVVEYLRTRLDELQRQQADLKRQSELLEARMNQVSELYRATEAVLQAEIDGGAQSTPAEDSWAAIKPRLRTMTLKKAIRAVVGMHGQDGIHVKDIYELLKEAGFPLRARDPKASIAGSIHIEIRNEGTYQKVAPNTFRLAEPDALSQGAATALQSD